jgi:acetyltransferase-like isoleucine patch superfamily enzyme
MLLVSQRRLRSLTQRASARAQRLLEGPQGHLWRSGVATAGYGTYGRPTIRYYDGDSARVTIGKYCSIASGVVILPGGNHRTDWVSTYPFRIQNSLEGAARDGHPYSKGDVVIGNDVWLGMESLILSGVAIGDGAVVAARSVVTKDVEPYTIVGGNPAKVIGTRFSETQRQVLLALRWWDWPPEVVLERVPHLNGSDVASFIRLFDGRSVDAELRPDSITPQGSGG